VRQRAAALLVVHRIGRGADTTAPGVKRPGLASLNLAPVPWDIPVGEPRRGRCVHDSGRPRRRRPINGRQMSLVWAGCMWRRQARRWPTSAFCESARQQVGLGSTQPALAFAQQQALNTPVPDYRFARPDASELTIELAT